MAKKTMDDMKSKLVVKPTISLDEIIQEAEKLPPLINT